MLIFNKVHPDFQQTYPTARSVKNKRLGIEGQLLWQYAVEYSGGDENCFPYLDRIPDEYLL
jgi:hypothetical protein